MEFLVEYGSRGKVSLDDSGHLDPSCLSDDHLLSLVGPIPLLGLGKPKGTAPDRAINREDNEQILDSPTGISLIKRY